MVMPYLTPELERRNEGGLKRELYIKLEIEDILIRRKN
ncbi:hypothetical protein AusDCA_3719 [Desulfitobacterium sp. AusDCA]